MRLQAMKTTIFPHHLVTAFARAPVGIEMLSLDCFDTLIWRNLHSPRDLFHDLTAAGASKQQRIWAERHARTRALLRHGREEATICEIHAALLQDRIGEAHAASVTAELEAEARHCYAFRPTADLIADAKSRGLKVAIVSDTYLDRAQLSALIRSVGGETLLEQIDHVFCSSEYGQSKAEGLFRHVLRETGVAPGRVLHIGDNPVADFEAATAAGIHALHLVQFDEPTQQRLRFEAAAGTMVNSAGATLPACQAHRAAVALVAPTLGHPAETMGYAALGPVFHTFSRWLADEAAALVETGQRPRFVFLMRDGHLPQRVFEAMGLSSDLPRAAVEISRFTATAANLQDEGAVLTHLEHEVEGGDFEGIARQLLFSRGEISKLMQGLPTRGRARAFANAVRSPGNMRKVIERSRAFATRLAAHVRRETACAEGDTLVFVDLGYNGTVQDQIETILGRELGARVAGRYLLLREQKLTGRDKKGLFDQRHYDPATLDTFCANAAVLEQLCTAAQGSVVDYEPNGRAIRNENSIKSRQSGVRERVQQGCISFATERDSAFVRAPVSDTSDTRREAAAAALARLMFLPLPEEMGVLEAFEHDINLGLEGTVRLFDPAVADQGLRRRGLFYMKGAERMYLPAELRGHGLPLSLAVLAQCRFGLDLRYPDFCDASIDLPIIVADGNDVLVHTVKATATHDGYFMAAIPIGDCRYAIGVQFGRLYEWVQVDSVQFLPVADFLSEHAAALPPPTDGLPSLEGMEQVAPHLMRCHDETAFMMVPPPIRREAVPVMLTVVFRPIAAREPVPAPAARPVQASHAGVAL